MTRFRSLFAPTAFGLSCLAVTLLGGCAGEPKPKQVTGKIVLPKVKLDKMDQVIVVFNPEDESGRTAATEVNREDLTFTGMVVPGKYKISVSFQPFPGTTNDVVRQEQFDQTINSKYGATTSPLTVEVKDADGQSFTVDLVKNTVTSD